MENMSIYEAGRAVPKEATKPFENGTFKGTDINPMWRIKKLTELFGPCGIGWYYEVVSERCEEHAGTTISVVDLNLYIKVDGEWSKPIFGTGGNQIVRQTKSGARVSDEGYKMALTDAISVACKALGIGADVYFANDKTKYTDFNAANDDQPKAEAKPEPTLNEKLKAKKPEAKQGSAVIQSWPKIPDEEWKPRMAAQEWAHEQGLTVQEFADFRTAVIEAKLAEDKPVKDLSKLELATLCRMIELNRRTA